MRRWVVGMAGWEGLAGVRTFLSCLLGVAAISLGFATSMTVEGLLRYIPVGVALVLVGAVVALPGRRGWLVLVAGPLAFGWIGAVFVAGALASFAVSSTAVAIWLRLGRPRRSSDWPDIPVGRVRCAALIIAVGCGIVGAVVATETMLARI